MNPWHINWQTEPARRDNPINRHPPPRFPYLFELMRDRTVLAALDLAWHETNADVRPVVSASEQGGWIYMNMVSGQLTIVRKDNPLGPAPRPGENPQGYLTIDLNFPPVIAGSVVVADFHTHPSVPFGGASTPDNDIDMYHGVPGIVRGQQEAYDMIGPPRRIDDFHTAISRPGYPNPSRRS